VLTPKDFAKGAIRILALDEERGVAKFSDKIEVPLHPFFGSVGVAPSESAGCISSGPPGIYSGNLDNKDLVAGIMLFLAVH